MTGYSSFRLSITKIQCFTAALQCIFSRYLILGYPKKRWVLQKINRVLEKEKTIEGGLQTEKIFPASPPSPYAGRQVVRSGRIIVAEGNL